MGRSDELEVAAPADLGEVRVLAQEAVAGMDRLDVGDLGGGDDPGDVQVTVGAGGLADADRAVGQREVRRIAVGLRVDGDHLDAQLLAGADDPQRDLTTVGHQNTLKHRQTWSSATGHAGLTRNMGCPNSTDCPFLTRTSVIVPETPAGMSVKTFIASMTQTVESGRTTEPTVTKGGASGELEA